MKYLDEILRWYINTDKLIGDFIIEYVDQFGYWYREYEPCTNILWMMGASLLVTLILNKIYKMNFVSTLLTLFGLSLVSPIIIFLTGIALCIVFCALGIVLFILYWASYPIIHVIPLIITLIALKGIIKIIRD